MEITIKLTSLTQAEALRAALELHIDMETDRCKDSHGGFKPADAAQLSAAKQVLAMITGRK